MSNVRPVYYIGDIHGRNDLLINMLKGIEDHANARGASPTVYFLGDLTDRGYESNYVMENVYQTLKRWDTSLLVLGNHDEWFMDALKHGYHALDYRSWITYGGAETIMSYFDGDEPNGATELIKAQHPHHLQMLRDAVKYTENGPFIGVHAGIMPTLPLSEQRDYYLNWIREPFLDFVEPAMRPVIHGHTIQGELPVVTENRISIDTGAYETGKLTCCFIDPEAREFSLHQSTTSSFYEVKPVLMDRGHGTIYDRLDELFDQVELERKPGAKS